MAGWIVRVVAAAVVAIAGVLMGYAGADTGVILGGLNDAPINVVTDYLP